MLTSLGKSENTLKKRLGSDVEITSNGLLLSGADVTSLTESEKNKVLEGFEAGEPIILLFPSYVEINLVADIIGVGYISTKLTGSPSDMNVYCICKEEDTFWQATFYSSTVGQKALNITHIDDNGVKMTNRMDLGTYVINEKDDYSLDRVKLWLGESGKRNKSDLAIQAGKNATTGQNQLTELASAFISQADYELQDKDGNKAYYTISSFAYACFSQDNRDNWFYIQQFGVFNPSNVFNTDTELQRGWYTDLYEQNCYPTNYGDSTAVNLITSSPQTTINSKTATSSVSYNIGGSVGFSGKAGTGSVSGGMSVSNSTSVEIPDMTINNRSLSSRNNAAWQFVMPRCGGNDDGCVNSLTGTVGISHSTFQPMNQWIWRVDEVARSANGLSISSEFKTRWINSYMTGDCNIFGCNCDVGTQEWMPDMGLHTFSVPFPPNA